MPFFTIDEKLKFVESVFGVYEIHSRGNIQVKCPNCIKINSKLGLQTKKRKLAIATNKNWVLHCWVCGYKGNMIRCLKEFFSKSILTQYIQKFGTHYDSFETDDRDEKVDFPLNFKLLVNDDGFFAKKCKKYLYSRGAEEKDLWFFRFGTAQDSDWMWKNRVIMPSFDLNGDINYVCARDVSNTLKFKYWDSFTHKKQIIFNEFHIDWGEELTLVEGIFDLIKCNENAVPLLGSDLVEDSFLFMKIVQNQTPILLALDNDMKNSKLVEIADMLVSYGITVRVLDLEHFKDVGEMTKKDFLKARKLAQPWGYSMRLRQKIGNLSLGQAL